jgi:membrane associated rhomboid family serine protease
MGTPGVPTLGASGGIYGLLLAFGWYFPQRRVVLLFPPIPMSARTFVVVFAALELFFGVTGTAAGVAHFAHLGGMLGGWLMIEYRRRYSRR